MNYILNINFPAKVKDGKLYLQDEDKEINYSNYSKTIVNMSELGSNEKEILLSRYIELDYKMKKLSQVLNINGIVNLIDNAENFNK